MRAASRVIPTEIEHLAFARDAFAELAIDEQKLEVEVEQVLHGLPSAHPAVIAQVPLFRPAQMVKIMA